MSTSQSIFCVGVDHHATPLRIREILASSAPERWIPHLIEYRGADEVVFLSTCNRVEIYGRTERRGLEILSALAQALPHELGKNWRDACGVYLHEGISCWRHLAEVASGLRSMVVGESEILAQVRQAYGASHEAGGAGKAMHALFQSSLRAAKSARAAAGFGKGDASVGKLASEAMDEILEGKERRPLLVLGSGLTARSFILAEKSFSNRPIWVSSRSEERLRQFAQDVGAEAVLWSDWPRAVKAASVVVSALAGGELPWSECETRGPELLLDLGVPRTLTGLRRSFPQSKWVDLEELARRSEVKPSSLQAIHRAEEVLRKHEESYVLGRVRRDGSMVFGE